MADKEQTKAPGADLVDAKAESKPTNPEVKNATKAERTAMEERMDAARERVAAAVHGPEAYSDPKSPFFIPVTAEDIAANLAKTNMAPPALPEPYRMEDGGDYVKTEPAPGTPANANA